MTCATYDFFNAAKLDYFYSFLVGSYKTSHRTTMLRQDKHIYWKCDYYLFIEIQPHI